MTYKSLIIISIIFMGCSQKYYKDNIRITKDEYLFYKKRCEKHYKEYLISYNSDKIYAMLGQKRHHDEYMRECMEVINKVSLSKKNNNLFYTSKNKESNEINIFKMENNIFKISK